MIRYQLGCTADHTFESWFRDSGAFDEQVGGGLLSCPVCGTSEVSKSIMAPAVVGTGKVSIKGVPAEMPVSAPPPMPGATPGPLLDPRQQLVRAAMRAVREKIMSQGTDVGTRFPQEARDMHEGSTPMRPIRGEATLDEARGLLEDGIMVMPIPPAPEELN